MKIVLEFALAAVKKEKGRPLPCSLDRLGVDACRVLLGVERLDPVWTGVDGSIFLLPKSWGQVQGPVECSRKLREEL